MFAENAAHRSIAACLECRSRKQKCDGLSNADGMCTRCKQKGRRCVWPAPVPAPTVRLQQQQSAAATAGPSRPLGGPSSSAALATAPTLTPVGDFSITPPARLAGKRGASDFQTSGSGSGSSVQVNRDDDEARQRHRSRRRRSENESVTPHNPAPLASLREMALLTPSGDEGDRDSGRRSTGDQDIGIADEDGDEDGDSDSDDSSKLNIDEQIQALQTRMGWTAGRLHEASTERREFFRDAVAQEPASLERIDPLHTGLLETQDAERLFSLFYDTINVQHCLLDPRHDDWHAVHHRSRALFIVICAATATIDEHTTSRRCVATLVTSMDEAVRQVLQSNAKSVEVVQALLLAFLYGQKTTYAREDLCWTLVDAAARIASELGLGQRLRSAPATAAADNDAAFATPVDDHAQRNAERAWALAILMQRSLGTFTGLWSVTKLDVRWNSLEDWCEAQPGTPGDVQHAAYLNLRRIEYHARSQLQKRTQKRFLSLEAIRVGFNALFEEWHQRWVDHDKLAGHYAMKSFLMVIGLHIRLLINFTIFRLSQDTVGVGVGTAIANSHDDAHTQASPLPLRCAEMATHFCQFFFDNFERRANHLGRNIVSMVTWSVMVLLQLDYRRGRLLATRVAVLLAGHADDEVHRRTFPRFYGRWLLSLVHDLACTSSERKACALLKSLSRGCHCASRQTCTHTAAAAAAATSAGDETVRGSAMVTEPGATQTVPTAATAATAAPPGGQEAPADATVSAEQVLAHMIGPMTTDPFNEVWLNSLLDSLVPPPYSPDDAPGAAQPSPFVGGGGGGGGGSS